MTGGCPGSDRGASNIRPGPTTSLLPPGLPTAGLACSYNGLNGAAFTLRSHVRLNATRAERLAREAKAIGLAHANGGSGSCPMDDGTATVIAFEYRGGANATLWLNDTGCRSVSNGTIAVGSDGDYAALTTFATAVTALLPH